MPHRRGLVINLRSAIAARGLRQWWVAEELNIPRLRFCRIIGAREEASASERKKLARLLQYDEEWLFKQDTSSPAWRKYFGGSGGGPTDT